MSENDGAALVAECGRIVEDSLYTAQAHFEVAHDIERKQRLPLLVLPAFVAGVCGIMTAVGLPTWIGAVGAAAGLISGVAGAIGVDKKSDAHQRSANAFTALRHDARFAQETRTMKSALDFARTVESLHSRYNDLTAAAPMTTNEAFEKARLRIRAGRFERDN